MFTAFQKPLTWAKKNDELGKIVSLASVIKYGISRRDNLYFMNLAVLLCEMPNVVVILFST